MAVRTDIAVPDPTIIGAWFRGTVLGIGVYCSWAPSLGGDQERRCRRWLVDVSLALLTGRAKWLLGQAGKGLGNLWRFLSPLSWRGVSRPGSFPTAHSGGAPPPPHPPT